MIGRLAFAGFVLAVTGVVAQGAAQATWHGMGLHAAPPPPPLVMRVAAKPVETDLSPIHTLAPFGRRVVPEPVAAPPAQPLTPLVTGLTLRGVMVASAGGRSVAVIAAPGVAAARYTVGERVAERATLTAVSSDRAVLTEGSRREILWLNDKDAPAAPAGAPATGAMAGLTSVARPGAGIPNRPVPRPAATAGPSGAKSVDEIIDLYRRRIAVNPRAVIDRFGVTPTAEGYRVGPAPSEGVVRAGLRPGDIIAEVNGEAVGTIEKDRRLFERVVASGFARARIIRGGQEIVLSFPFR